MGDLNIVKLLVDNHANINDRSDKLTALIACT